MEDTTAGYTYNYKANLHFHSRLSDGAYGLEELLNIINDSEFDILSLTDHNNIENSLRLYDSISKKIAILGIEISTSDLIEVLVYFRNKEEFLAFFEEYIRNKKKRFWNVYVKIDIFKFIEKVKKYDTLLGVPHPFGRKGIIRRLYKREFSLSHTMNFLQNFDFYEVLNSTKSQRNNAIAMEWYNTNKPNILAMASSDFHSIKNSFNLAGTEIYSNYKLNSDNFFSLVRSRNRDNIMFVPYGKSLGTVQICLHHIWSFINQFSGG